MSGKYFSVVTIDAEVMNATEAESLIFAVEDRFDQEIYQILFEIRRFCIESN